MWPFKKKEEKKEKRPIEHMTDKEYAEASAYIVEKYGIKPRQCFLVKGETWEYKEISWDGLLRFYKKLPNDCQCWFKIYPDHAKEILSLG